MSLTTSLATQSMILRANQAEMAAIRANQAQQDLIGSNGDFNSIARKEAQIEQEKLRAQTNARVAKAQKEALKSKRRKLDVVA